MKYYRLRYVTTSGISMLFKKIYNEHDKREMEATDIFTRNTGILSFEYAFEWDETTGEPILINREKK